MHQTSKIDVSWDGRKKVSVIVPVQKSTSFTIIYNCSLFENGATFCSIFPFSIENSRSFCYFIVSKNVERRDSRKMKTILDTGMETALESVKRS